MNWRIKKLELNVHDNDLNRGLYVSNVNNYNVQKSFWSKRKECCKPDRKSYRILSSELKNEYNSEFQGTPFNLILSISTKKDIDRCCKLLHVYLSST